MRQIQINKFQILALVVFCAALNLSAAPTLSYRDQTITVEGVTPGGTVAIFAVLNELGGGVPMRTREAVLLQDEDRDGTIHFIRPRTVPAVSIWIVVDLASGQRAVAGGPGFTPVPLNLTDVARHDNPGQLRKLSADLGEIEVMVVRPGTGAWELYAAKTSKADESRRDEPLRIDIGSLRPIGKSPSPPNALKQGDIVAIVDPYAMRYFVTEVGK